MYDGGTTLENLEYAWYNLCYLNEFLSFLYLPLFRFDGETFSSFGNFLPGFCNVVMSLVMLVWTLKSIDAEVSDFSALMLISSGTIPPRKLLDLKDTCLLKLCLHKNKFFQNFECVHCCHRIGILLYRLDDIVQVCLASIRGSFLIIGDGKYISAHST